MSKIKLLLLLFLLFQLTSCKTILKIEEWRAKADFYSILLLTIIGDDGFLISEFRKKDRDK